MISALIARMTLAAIVSPVNGKNWPDLDAAADQARTDLHAALVLTPAGRCGVDAAHAIDADAADASG